MGITVIDSILARLDGVRKCGNGWMARCPAHEDKTPSLIIKNGDRGILLNCFAGCTLNDICSSLGIRSRDLFYDSDRQFDHSEIRRRQREKESRHRREKSAFLVDARRIDCLRESDSVIRAATGVDISAWTDGQLDRAMDVISDAWRVLCDQERKEVLHAA